ncbi:MAG: amino acid decarboxylase [Acidobacteria bacterium]|nr:amino acid decarboxylase [Acidobacteriota bacterium]MBI3655679.1 amino acid decarboxylase [Acidobacteriota bacterium]
MAPEIGDMSPEAFRAYGYRLIDWIADYLKNAESYPVLAQVRPGDIARQLPPQPPLQAESFDEILEDFEKLIIPGVTHWNHPAFMAYFAISAPGPGILGELLSGALNINAMLWKTCPAASELEEVVLDWLRQMLGLSGEFSGVLMDTASISSLCALAAARAAIPNYRIRTDGLAGRQDVPPLRLYVSEQAHSSIEKAAILLGIGQNHIRKIAVDDAYRLRPDMLSAAIAEDRAAGLKPFCAVATVGTTATTSVDPVAAMAPICREHQLWLHVDAAYAGSAAILPECRPILDGCEAADSLVLNPHKWMFTPFDFSVLYCRHMEILRSAFSLVPDYLQTTEGEHVRNYMDYGIQLGRRFRALKFWFVIRYFGVEGLQRRLREHIRLAQHFAKWVDQQADFERMAPVPFSTVCFRWVPKALGDSFDMDSEKGRTRLNEAIDLANEKLLDEVNKTGQAYLSSTKLQGRTVLRLTIGNIRTTEAHLRRVWALLNEHTQTLVQDVDRL